MKNIFETLKEKGICYAVGVALVAFRSKCAGLCDRDYYIIAATKDKKQLRGLKFYDSQDKIHDVVERGLNAEEIRLFKELQNDFIKVKHDENGRVYELKNNSFKKYYSGLAKNKACTTVD